MSYILHMATLVAEIGKSWPLVLVISLTVITMSFAGASLNMEVQLPDGDEMNISLSTKVAG